MHCLSSRASFLSSPIRLQLTLIFFPLLFKESQYIVHTGLEFAIPLPQLPEWWDFRCMAPYPTLGDP